MFTILDEEGEYTREYDRFVKGVSYAPDNTLPTFKEAIEKVNLLADHML